jgi:methionyl-tRNA formyltransferase
VRLVYFGTSSFAVPALERLAPQVLLVVTQPDRPSGRGMEMRPSAVRVVAERLGLDIATPEKVRDPEFVERLRGLEADAFVVASFGQILSKSVLEVPRLGCFNLHASLLPKYRGASPIQYAILNGEHQTGVTLMQMDAGMDSGGIIEKSTVDIGPDETAGELHDRLALVAADLIEGWIHSCEHGCKPPVPQDPDQATFAPKVSKSDSELSFDRPVQKEYDRFRAFTPLPGAWVQTSHGPLKIKEARRASAKGQPGIVVSTRPFEVAFADGALEFVTVQPEGRKAMSGEDYANGARLAQGDCLKP